MTTQNAVPCGLQAVVAIHRNQGRVAVARLKRERVRVTEERDIVKRAAMSFAQESRCRRASSRHRPGRFACGPCVECYRWADAASSPGSVGQGVPVGTPIRPSSQRRRVLDQQTRAAYGARKRWHLLTRAGCPLFPGHLSPWICCASLHIATGPAAHAKCVNDPGGVQEVPAGSFYATPQGDA